eukprot:1293081-Ditylum_brightwellii.AAC.1
MEVKIIPLFLEGPVCMMKTVNNEKVCTIYNNIKEAKLSDEELKMYKISLSLKGQSYDMILQNKGRSEVLPILLAEEV